MVPFFRTRSLHREAQAPPELKRAHPAERALYPLGIVAPGVGACPGRELLQGDARQITPHEVLRAYDVLTHFRNLCAHDERLYCAKVDNDDYVTMLKLMEVALPRDVVRSMKKNIERLLQKYSDKLNAITAHDLGNCLGL